MKRFFQPVAAAASKKAKPGEDGDGCGGERPDPLTFMTWNANSLLGRLRKEGDRANFFAYVKEHDPDVIALQETWLPAAGPTK